MRQRVLSIIAVCFVLALLGVLLWFGDREQQDTVPSDKVSVVVTVYPLEEVARRVGGEYVVVQNIVPVGAEPHDYEPTPRDVIKVLDADILVYVGGGLDEAIEEIAPQVEERGGIARGMEDYLAFYAAGDDDDHAEGGSGHDHAGIDPHIWLDPVLMQDVVAVVRDALLAADPDHADEYRANADTYISELAHLDQDYVKGLQQCAVNDIIVSHDAFGYLARRYGMTVHAISGLSPEAEPSVRDLTRLATTARELGVNTIFFETLVSPDLAQTLADEIGAHTAILNPLEGLSEDELRQGKDYLVVMRSNLEALRKAMLCR